MESKRRLFTLKSGQRYYYIVALQFQKDDNYNLTKYWKDCANENPVEKIQSYKFENYEVSHSRYITSYPYYTGDKKDYSINDNKKAPYSFDLFAIHIQQSNIMILAFPFRLLAMKVIARLLDKKILKRSSFIKPILTNLLKVNHEVQFQGKKFSSHFSAVELTLTGIVNLSSVSLTGDKPLESTIYQKVFKLLIEKEKGKLDKCALNFSTDEPQPGYPKSKANIHLDHFGNYRLYIHSTGNNLLTLPALFNLLENYDSCDMTSNNPLERLANE
jgi:hypothetical protein